MSLTDLNRLRENASEAGRLIDLADRRIYDVLMRLSKSERVKYEQTLNDVLNLMNCAVAKLPKPKSEVPK
jgi:hypothetical protein